MKNLDFNPAKSGNDFRKNYRLHDLAEHAGKNLLTQWGIDFKEFGKDNRYQKVWEKGLDKPDAIISYKGQSLFLDWKGKHKPFWMLNERAILAYERWSQIYSLPIIIAFFVFDKQNLLLQRRFAFLGEHNYIESVKRQWDKNKTVEFRMELPQFSKANLLNSLINSVTKNNK